MKTDPQLSSDLSIAYSARDRFDGVTVSLIAGDDRQVPEAYRRASYKHEFPGKLFSSKKFPFMHPTLLHDMERNH